MQDGRFGWLWRRRRYVMVVGALVSLTMLTLGARKAYPFIRLVLKGVPTQPATDSMAGDEAAAPRVTKGPVDAAVYHSAGVIRQEVDMATVAAHQPLAPRSLATTPDVASAEGRDKLAENNRRRQHYVEERLRVIADNPVACAKWKQMIAAQYGMDSEKTKFLLTLFDSKKFYNLAQIVAE